MDLSTYITIGIVIVIIIVAIILTVKVLKWRSSSDYLATKEAKTIYKTSKKKKKQASKVKDALEDTKKEADEIKTKTAELEKHSEQQKEFINNFATHAERVRNLPPTEVNKMHQEWNARFDKINGVVKTSFRAVADAANLMMNQLAITEKETNELLTASGSLMASDERAKVQEFVAKFEEIKKEVRYYNSLVSNLEKYLDEVKFVINIEERAKQLEEITNLVKNNIERTKTMLGKIDVQIQGCINYAVEIINKYHWDSKAGKLLQNVAPVIKTVSDYIVGVFKNGAAPDISQVDKYKYREDFNNLVKYLRKVEKVFTTNPAAARKGMIKLLRSFNNYVDLAISDFEHIKTDLAARAEDRKTSKGRALAKQGVETFPGTIEALEKDKGIVNKNLGKVIKILKKDTKAEQATEAAGEELEEWD